MRKDKYVERILQVLQERGLDLSMDELADALCITKKTLYNHFSSKDELIDTCTAVWMEEFKEKISCLSDTSIPADEGFTKGILQMQSFFRNCCHSFIEGLSKYYPEMANESHNGGNEYLKNQLRLNIENGKKEGIYRSETDSSLFSRYIASSIFHFFLKDIMRTMEFSADYYFEQVIAFNLNALSKV